MTSAMETVELDSICLEQLKQVLDIALRIANRSEISYEDLIELLDQRHEQFPETERRRLEEEARKQETVACLSKQMGLHNMAPDHAAHVHQIIEDIFSPPEQRKVLTSPPYPPSPSPPKTDNPS